MNNKIILVDSTTKPAVTNINTNTEEKLDVLKAFGVSVLTMAVLFPINRYCFQFKSPLLFSAVNYASSCTINFGINAFSSILAQKGLQEICTTDLKKLFSMKKVSGHKAVTISQVGLQFTTIAPILESTVKGVRSMITWVIPYLNVDTTREVYPGLSRYGCKLNTLSLKYTSEAAFIPLSGSFKRLAFYSTRILLQPLIQAFCILLYKANEKVNSPIIAGKKPIRDIFKLPSKLLSMITVNNIKKEALSALGWGLGYWTIWLILLPAVLPATWLAPALSIPAIPWNIYMARKIAADS
ncbi:MAG: hypothetical protein ABIH39_05565, partial [Candidatus Margulisiibacteriota bacterium]